MANQDPYVWRDPWEPMFMKIMAAKVVFSQGWSAGYESALAGLGGKCLDEAMGDSGILHLLDASGDLP